MTDHPALKAHPTRLTVEVTTRCNMRCAMCVKQAHGNHIGDADMTPEGFARLVPSFNRLESLVLTGIGEPLMNPHLEDFASLAREIMPETGRIGLQTNGRILTDKRAAVLAEAGVDRVCVSVDSAVPKTFRSLRSGGELAEVERAFTALDGVGDKLEPGAETVVLADTVHGLPDMVRWVAARGARFMIVSHMLPYAQGLESQVAHPSFTDEALGLYRKYAARAEAEGLFLDGYLKMLWRFNKTAEQRRTVELVLEMLEEAREKGVWMRPQRLLGHDHEAVARLEDAFGAAMEVARKEGVDLRLPASVPRFDRRCDFIEEGRAFVDREGYVHPCHFLWHRYVCHLDGRRKPVTPVHFGSVNGQGLAPLWNGTEYRQFRERVLRYDYPYCLDCAMTPCDLIETEPFDYDCYGRDVPCCDCPWALGLYQCLG